MSKLKNWQIGIIGAAFVIVVVGVWLALSYGGQEQGETTSADSTTVPDTVVTAGGSLQAIQESGVLRVAINPGLAPMEFYDDEEIVGFDVDLADEIAKQLNVEVELIVYETLDTVDADLIAGDFNGDFDIVISAMGIKERRIENSLAVPYFESGVTIMTTVDNQDISDLTSLDGYTVAAVVGSGEHREVSNLSGVTVVDAANYDEVVSILVAGDADAAVLDVPVALLALKNNSGLRVVAEPFESMWYGIYMEGDEIALFERITEIIRDLQASGTFDNIYANWF